MEHTGVVRGHHAFDKDCTVCRLEAENKQLEKYEAIEENAWDLRCTDIPTGGDDYDIGWIIVEHHIVEPRERIIGRGKTPIEAITEALKE